MVLFRLVDRSIGLISTLILARLLVPSDFGVVAMAMSVIAIIELATSFSFEIGLIQKANLRREHYDTAWTLNVMIAAGGALLTAALAAPMASFYGEPRLMPVMLAIAGGWLVSGFENVGIVDFRRNMDFKSEFRFLVSKRFLGFFVTTAAAVTFRSYWALVTGMVFSRVLGVVLSYLMHPFRPRASLAVSRELFSFSGWLLANNLVGVALSKLPHFFVGRVLGAQALGAYTLASELAQLVLTELIGPINRALFPGYARMASDLEAFRKTCVDVTSVILLVVLPASIGIAVLSEPMVRVLLGEQWRDAAPAISYLALASMVSATNSNNASAYLALGKARLTTIILLTRLCIVVPLLLVLPGRIGLVGVAQVELAASAISLAVSLPLLFRYLQIPASLYFASAWRPLLSSLAMGLCVFAVNSWLNLEGSMQGALAQLFIGVGVGVLSYGLSILLLWHLAGRPQGAERLVLQAAWSALARFRKPVPDKTTMKTGQEARSGKT